jgi:hypothetical protein
MATQLDHSQNIKARLFERLKALERECEEVRDLLAAQDRIDKVLGSGSLPRVTQPASEPQKPQVRTLQNRNVTALVREYIDKYSEDAALNVTTIVRDYLIDQHGVKGKYRSLYAAVCVILKKETQSNQSKSARLNYVKGAGFFKRRQD